MTCLDIEEGFMTNTSIHNVGIEKSKEYLGDDDRKPKDMIFDNTTWYTESMLLSSGEAVIFNLDFDFSYIQSGLISPFLSMAICTLEHALSLC